MVVGSGLHGRYSYAPECVINFFNISLKNTVSKAKAQIS